MNSAPTSGLAAVLLLAACSFPSARQPGPAMEAPGVPPPAAAGSTPGRAAAPRALEAPDRIEFPATYRLVMVEGHLLLVRETDAQALAPPPTSLRAVAGEVARGELAFQPGLLPQELAAQVAANRESAARLDNALAEVMERSRLLSAQALDLKAQSQRLADQLAAARAARPPAAAPAPVPPPAAPDPE